jgi:hypothetical protein
VILTLSGERTTRRSADGRWPVDTGTNYSAVALNQITASQTGSGSLDLLSESPTPVTLEIGELTVLTGWAEGLAEALAYTPGRARGLLADAHPGASWRTDLGIAEPSPRLNQAIKSIGRALAATTPTDGTPSFDALLDSVRQDPDDEQGLDRLVRQVLRSTLEQLRSRQATEADQRSNAPLLSKQ